MTPLQYAKDNRDRINDQAGLMATADGLSRDIMRGLLTDSEAVVAREQLKVDEAAAEKALPYYGKMPF